MKRTLIELFRKSIELGEVEYSHEQIANRWLGNEPAKLEDITEAEQRLDLILPNDYKEMLLICNGFKTSSTATDPSFLKIQEVDYYRNHAFSNLEVYDMFPDLKEVKLSLESSILVAGSSEEQQFLLIPPSEEFAHWRYWKYAHWIPGEEEYADLKSYFQFVIHSISKFGK